MEGMRVRYSNQRGRRSGACPRGEFRLPHPRVGPSPTTPLHTAGKKISKLSEGNLLSDRNFLDDLAEHFEESLVLLGCANRHTDGSWRAPRSQGTNDHAFRLHAPGNRVRVLANFAIDKVSPRRDRTVAEVG